MSSEESCFMKCGRFLKSPQCKLYISYAFSTWGDRMWTFALSIALFSIGGNLRLPAVTGFANCLTVLIFGAAVGKFIDRTPRLKAAQVSLTVNNLTVALSAAALVAVMHWENEVTQIWNGGLKILLIVLSIFLCAVSVLAGTGTKICVSKDWVVVLCKKDTNKLANMNAMLLRIDLTAMIISPLVAGQIMTSISIAAGCFFIAVWNVCSYGIEFCLLLAVYRSVPELSVKMSENVDKNSSATPLPAASVQGDENQSKIEKFDLEAADESKPMKDTKVVNSHPRGNIAKLLSSMVSGWRTYFGQSVFPAGFGLALLYLTVMGLDGITSGFAYSQGIKENVLAAVRGAGAVTGISGSFMFPKMRARIGLERTGLISLILELSALCVSVASVWLPGSPFDVYGAFHGSGDTVNNSTVSPNSNSSEIPILSSTPQIVYPDSMCSIWAFLVGIVFARFGLWTADLSITQIMQESVSEDERGVVFGVQSAMNQLLNLLKDILVIVLPDAGTFGLLIIVSWISVFCGFLSYSVYSRRIRGHLLPFHGNRYKDVNFDVVAEKDVHF